MKTGTIDIVARIAASLACGALGSAQGSTQAAPQVDATARAAESPSTGAEKPVLYVVGYAHLDTEWRWTYVQTIRDYLRATLDQNFALIDKYPSYVFNFSGSRRYEMIREYYPEGYAELKDRIAAGRWFPCGSSVDENDANVPSAESLVRQVLYGNGFFRREFGVASEEYMLPDCFGFPAALPSVLAHCGIRGFSTQKLTWNASVPIPFKVGLWEGPDGRSVIAALDPGSYSGEVLENLAESEGWRKRIEANGKRSGSYLDYHYYGTGDMGGGPTERSVAMVEKSASTDGAVEVVPGQADLMFSKITDEARAKLPRYQGELQLTEHSAGSITSQAYMKRWNRKNELLADSAERVAVAAAWLGGRDYPARKLEDAWTLVLGSQMHDILPGTSLPRAYDYAWNDELLASNLFAEVLTDSAGVVAGMLDTRGDGVPLVVANPLSTDREDVVEAEIPGPGGRSVEVTGPDGKLVPAQVLARRAGSLRIAFLARVPSIGYAVFHARPTDKEPAAASSLRVDEHMLENGRYHVRIDDNGDVFSIFDREAKQELLSAPIRLGLHHENPKNWPAWNQDWADRQRPAREFVGGPARIRVVERGPARVSVEVSRESGPSRFVQRVRLSAGGAGDRVEFDTDIDWLARERSLRVAFPLAVSNPKATYDLQVGALERPNGHEKQFEYAKHQWFDLTDSKGGYGVSVFDDSKYGCDKPSDGLVRLTLLHTPGTRGGYEDQGTQDLGRHHVLYAVAGHAGDWRAGKSAQEAARLNQPLHTFRADAHEGPLGRSFSFLRVSDDAVRISAVKRAEQGARVVVRLRELSGVPKKNVRIEAAVPILSAREIDGQEREIGAAKVEGGALVADVGGFELRAFALELGPPAVAARRPQSTPIAIAFDADVASTNVKRGDGTFDAQGRSLPAEQLPAKLSLEDVSFELGPTSDGARNALVCRGQELALPAEGCDRLYLLAAADGDVETEVLVDGRPFALRVRDWTGFVGQWDRRSWIGDVPEVAFGWSNELGGIEPGYVEREPVAWYASHHHTAGGDAFYQYAYLYKCAIELPQGAKSVRLPKDERVRVLAASAVRSASAPVVPAAPLYDTFEDHVQDAPRIVLAVTRQPPSGAHKDAVEIAVEPGLYWRKGSIRLTTDGSAPVAGSPAYEGPMFLDRTATLSAAVVGPGGKLGPVVTARVEVEDATKPAVRSATPAYGSKIVRVEYSEPCGGSALAPSAYVFEPALAVRAVKPGAGAREVELELASPLEVDRAYRLTISGVTDTSPAKNALDPVTLDLTVHGPVYRVAIVSPEQMGTEVRDVAKLPVAAKSAWTLNLFVKTDAQPANRTVIAGFGRCEDRQDGSGRYLTKFANGIHFWSRNRDVEGKTPLELGQWQMLTATYDGRVLRLYEDAKKIGEREVAFADDENVVRFAPPDPWEKKRRFQGEIREFSVWDSALGDEALRALAEAAPTR